MDARHYAFRLLAVANAQPYARTLLVLLAGGHFYNLVSNHSAGLSWCGLVLSLVAFVCAYIDWMVTSFENYELAKAFGVSAAACALASLVMLVIAMRP